MISFLYSSCSLRLLFSRSKQAVPTLLILFSLFISSVAHARERFLDIQEHTTESGLSFWLVEDHSIPIISLQFAFENAGSKHDSSDKQGLARLASNTMDEGAGEFTENSFQEALRKNSISISFSSGRDTYGGSFKTRTSTKDLAVRMLSAALSDPHFEEKNVQRMKEANIARIRSSLSDPEWIAARINNDIAFEGHPYALNSGGTITSLQNLTREDLKAFAANRLTQDVLKISITGDVTASQAKVLVDQIFANLPQTQKLPNKIPDFNIQNAGKTFLYETDIPQSIIQSVQPALARNDPDYYAYRVMNQILGAGGFGSRLTEEIREKRGLTYGIYTSLAQMKHINFLTLGVQTANENARDVLRLSGEEMKKMANSTVSEDELNNAISYINGSLPLGLSSTSNIAALLLGMQLDDLPIDYLDNRADKFKTVKLTDVQRIAIKYLNPELMTTIIVGKPEGIKPENVTIVTELPNVE